MTNRTQEILARLKRLKFDGRAENFAEVEFVHPLFEALGYKQEDYDVIHHGDDGASFKLRFPAVELGAVKVKSYNPDYIPTMRKKMFWVVEAKSPKDVAYPFEAKYVVQGLQYCVHPEIQAKYLLVTNGRHSALYDAFGGVFLGQDIYQPVLEFEAATIDQKWSEIFEHLAPEKLRAKIERGLKSMYDKLASSSFDKDYPLHLAREITKDQQTHRNAIERANISLKAKAFDQQRDEELAELERQTTQDLLQLMESPPRPGKTVGMIYVDKRLAAGNSAADILSELIVDFDTQPIFRMEQLYIAVCHLHSATTDAQVKADAKAFIDSKVGQQLSPLTLADCAVVRMLRKMATISAYPDLQKRIDKDLQTAPEIIRFVHTPSAAQTSYAIELKLRHGLFEQLKLMDDQKLGLFVQSVKALETKIDPEFEAARAKLDQADRFVVTHEYFGHDGTHYALPIIAHNLNIPGYEKLP